MKYQATIQAVRIGVLYFEADDDADEKTLLDIATEKQGEAEEISEDMTVTEISKGDDYEIVYESAQG